MRRLVEFQPGSTTMDDGERMDAALTALKRAVPNADGNGFKR